MPSQPAPRSTPPPASRSDARGPASRAELLRALGVLSEAPASGHARLAELLGLPPGPDPEAHAALLLLPLHPTASMHVGAEGRLGGEARDRVAGFWAALGLLPPPEPDQLVALLGLLASLAEREGEAPDDAARHSLHRARRAFLWEHLLSWTFPYLDRVEELGSAYHAAWARLLRTALLEEAGELGRLDRLPLHLREAPELPDPRQEAGPDAFLEGLTAPVRAGFLLTRADLTRGARELGLGLRVGERRFVLRGLLSQEPARVLAWLGEEADRHADAHARWREPLGGVAEFWEGRARATGRRLAELGDGVAG